MGMMNILKANFHGKVGSVVGAKNNHTNIIRSLPRPLAHHTKAQTDALVNFGGLCRFSSTIARQFWNILGILDREMLKHNAVAHLFRGTLTPEGFKIGDLGDVIDPLHRLEITSSGISPDGTIGTVQFSSSLDPSILNDAKLAVIYADQYGEAFYYGLYNYTEAVINFGISKITPGKRFFIGLLSIKTNGKYKLVSAATQEAKTVDYAQFHFQGATVNGGSVPMIPVLDPAIGGGAPVHVESPRIYLDEIGLYLFTWPSLDKATVDTQAGAFILTVINERGTIAYTISSPWYTGRANQATAGVSLQSLIVPAPGYSFFVSLDCATNVSILESSSVPGRIHFIPA